MSQKDDLVYPNGTLVKNDSPSVYVISDEKRKPIISGSDFEALLYDWGNIKWVSSIILSKIELSTEIRLVGEAINIVSR